MTRNRKRLIACLGAGAAVIAGAATAAVAGHTNTLLESSLRGRNEVSATGSSKNVGDPNGRGENYVFGIDGDPKTLCYTLTVEKIAPATAAHIHKGAKGTNGPVVVNLAAPADGNAADCLTEGEAGKFVVDANGAQLTTVADILADPDGYYVNVHNAEYPGGAIRGQLVAQGSSSGHSHG
jgi:hypothetical protein